jgi:hypothetical protein
VASGAFQNVQFTRLYTMAEVNVIRQKRVKISGATSHLGRDKRGLRGGAVCCESTELPISAPLLWAELWVGSEAARERQQYQ